MTDRNDSTAPDDDFDDEEGPTLFKFEQPDDRLVGELVSIEFVRSSFSGTKYPFVELRGDDGTLYGVHAAQAALISQFRRKRPQPGERIAITFRGEAVGQSGRKYKDFSVRVRRDKHSLVDYDAELGADEPDDDDEYA